MSVVLGTAGHIDHGKTALVRALTGIDCDRLEEEKRRGITIELGFAWLDLPSGQRLGLVDVPGHERFIKNMVAGAAGMDCVLLVIAADEGVMPQTREHLEVCTLLGVRFGLIALTKTDLVEPEWLAMVTEDVRGFVHGTFLENASIFPVSSATGEGVEELRKGICTLASSLPERTCSDLFRLPVDRVFTLKGYGTIVTGTVISGACQVGDEMVFMPSALPVRARSLQNHGQPAQSLKAGQRCAVNVQGAEVADIERGMVLTHKDTLIPSSRWLLRLTALPSAPRPLRQRTEIHFHHGTRECLARVFFFDRDALLPGERALAEIRFSAPLVGIFGDHCVLRAYAPLRTIAGGFLVSPLPPNLSKKDPLRSEKLSLLTELETIWLQAIASSGDTLGARDRALARERLAATVLRLCGSAGTNEKELCILTGLSTRLVSTVMQRLGEKGEAALWDKEGRFWTSKDAFKEVTLACLAKAAELHEKNPLTPSFSRGALCSGWSDALPAKFVQAIVHAACKEGKLVIEGEGLRLSSHQVRLAENETLLREQLLEAYKKGGLTPPKLKDVVAALDVEEKAVMPVLRLLCDARELIKVKEGLYYYGPILVGVLEQVRAWFKTHETLDVVNLKDLLGLSRKYLITLLEYMDNSHMTVRVGDQRRLRQ